MNKFDTEIIKYCYFVCDKKDVIYNSNKEIKWKNIDVSREKNIIFSLNYKKSLFEWYARHNSRIKHPVVVLMSSNYLKDKDITIYKFFHTIEGSEGNFDELFSDELSYFAKGQLIRKQRNKTCDMVDYPFYEGSTNTCNEEVLRNCPYANIKDTTDEYAEVKVFNYNMIESKYVLACKNIDDFDFFEDVSSCAVDYASYLDALEIKVNCSFSNGIISPNPGVDNRYCLYLYAKWREMLEAISWNKEREKEEKERKIEEESGEAMYKYGNPCGSASWVYYSDHDNKSEYDTNEDNFDDDDYEDNDYNDDESKLIYEDLLSDAEDYSKSEDDGWFYDDEDPDIF